MKKNKKYEIIFFLFLLVLLFRANLVFALEINYPPVPGAEPPQVFLEKIKNGEPGYEPEKALPLYVKYFYSLFLTISGVAAFIAIVFGGFLYLVSVGSPAKMKNARDQISAGILGLIILLSSYLILTTINPQLTIFHISKQGITPSEFHKECVAGTGKCLPVPGAGPDECSSDADCPEEGKEVYVEIPLGWLIERVKAKAEIAEDQAEDVWYVGAENSIETHTSLEELAECLNELIQRCRCDRATEECPSELDDSECPEGECRDPCDRCIAADSCAHIDNSLSNLCYGIPESESPLLPCPDECNLRLVIDAKRAELDLLTAQLLMEREDAIIVKGILERELVKLKLAEALMRDSFYPPISHHNFAAIEEATSRTLEVWEDIEPIPVFSRVRGSGAIIPVPTPTSTPTSTPSGYGEEVDLLPYFQNTAGNNMSSGENFRVEGTNPFKICKSGDCSDYSGYYEKFSYDSNYIYYIEDTTWATAEGNIMCLDGGEAFYRRYGSYGITCGNHGSFSVGVPWAPRIMKVGQTFTHPQSIVGFRKGTADDCCDTQYSGNLHHTASLVYQGCINFPTGITSRNAIILRIGAGEGAENFYYDINRGWIGFDRGVFGSGAYITDPIDDYQEECLEIGTGPGVRFPGHPGVTLPSHIKDDPANFYVREKGNEDLIAAIKELDIILPLPLPESWVPPDLPPLDPAGVLPVELYCQNHPSWGGIRLGTGEPVYYMSRYGCNLTSFAMILRYLGFNYDPGDIANFVNENNLWHGGVSNRNLFDIFKEEENLSYNFQEITSDNISEELNNLHPIFTGCLNFDANGHTHWIVIKGIVEEEGTTYIYIADPYCGWESQGYKPYYKLSRQEYGNFRCGTYYISFENE